MSNTILEALRELNRENNNLNEALSKDEYIKKHKHLSLFDYPSEVAELIEDIIDTSSEDNVDILSHDFKDKFSKKINIPLSRIETFFRDPKNENLYSNFKKELLNKLKSLYNYLNFKISDISRVPSIVISWELIEDESLEKGSKKPLKESDKPAATSIEDAQKWVDYDMKKYGKISVKTNELVKKAGFQIIKDDHGDYEVTAGHFE